MMPIGIRIARSHQCCLFIKLCITDLLAVDFMYDILLAFQFLVQLAVEHSKQVAFEQSSVT